MPYGALRASKVLTCLNSDHSEESSLASRCDPVAKNVLGKECCRYLQIIFTVHIFTIIYHYLPHSFQSLPAPAPSCPQWTPGLSPGPWLIVETPPEFASSWWQGSSSVAANLKWDAYDAWNITAWVLSCLGTPNKLSGVVPVPLAAACSQSIVISEKLMETCIWRFGDFTANPKVGFKPSNWQLTVLPKTWTIRANPQLSLSQYVVSNRDPARGDYQMLNMIRQSVVWVWKFNSFEFPIS